MKINQKKNIYLLPMITAISFVPLVIVSCSSGGSSNRIIVVPKIDQNAIILLVKEKYGLIKTQKPTWNDHIKPWIEENINNNNLNSEPFLIENNKIITGGGVNSKAIYDIKSKFSSVEKKAKKLSFKLVVSSEKNYFFEDGKKEISIETSFANF